MKKLFCYILPVVLIITLLFSSCGTKSADSSGVTSPHETDTSFKVAIVQSDDNCTFTEMRKAFISRMRILGYDEAKMKFDIKNALGDSEKLNQIVSELATSDYNLVVPIATKAAVAVSQANIKAPSVFIGVTDPVANGLVTDPAKPDKNMTGTVYKSQPDELLTLCRILTPNVKSFGIVYTKGNAVAESTVESTKSVLNESAIPFEELTVEQTTDINAAITDLLTRTDALFIPDDVAVEKQIDSIITTATQNSKFVFSSSELTVKSGALASVCTSSTALAKSSAELADKILQGNAVSAVAVSMEVTPVKFISKLTKANMGVDVPTLENSQLI